MSILMKSLINILRRKANNMVNRVKPENKKQVGQWTWNSKRLNEKVIRLGDNECWPSTNFAQTQHGPLFGARKNNKP